MAEPPSELGAVNAILALALPAVAAPMVGAPGTVLVVVELSSLPPQATRAIEVRVVRRQPASEARVEIKDAMGWGLVSMEARIAPRRN